MLVLSYYNVIHGAVQQDVPSIGLVWDCISIRHHYSIVYLVQYSIQYSKPWLVLYHPGVIFVLSRVSTLQTLVSIKNYMDIYFSYKYNSHANSNNAPHVKAGTLYHLDLPIHKPASSCISWCTLLMIHMIVRPSRDWYNNQAKWGIFACF